jgi:HEAT repeat protein
MLIEVPMGRDLLAQLCALLRAPDAELQCAAARVLGALKTDDEAPRQALAEALRSGNQMVVAYAVDALASLGGAAALPHLVSAFAAPAAARARAIEAAVGFGAAAAPALREALASKDAAVRRGALEAFGRLECREALDAFLDAVFDPDPEAVRLAVAGARKWIEPMGEKDRLALLGRLRKTLGKSKPANAPSAFPALMKLLGFLRRPEAAPDLLARVGGKLPVAIRKDALVSLEHLDLSGADPKAVVEALLPLLKEEDWSNVVAPALAILGKVGIPKALAAKVQALRESPHAAVRGFATRALGAAGTAQAAETLIDSLASADFRERELAASALRGNPTYVPRLAAEMEKARDANHAWAIAGVLKACRESIPKPVVKRLLARGVARLAKRDEEGAKAFLEVARIAAPDLTRDALYHGGAAWLKKKRFDAAEGFLRYFERDDLATPDGVLALAVARLKRGPTAIDLAARGANPAIALFVRLLRRGEVPVAQRLLDWRRILAPADLLYLGFHFIEQPGAEHTLGVDLLQALAKAFPKSAEAKSAKQRLTTEKA